MKAHPTYDPKLEAALDEIDAALTAEILSQILLDLPETDEAEVDHSELIQPADRPGRRAKRRR